MIVSIHQPSYLPWLGYFEKIARSDIHVVLDTVQFEKNSFSNRNKIKTPQEWTWLSIPVLTKGKFGDLSFQNLEIDNAQKWQTKHLKTILMNYTKAPYFDQYKQGLMSFYENKTWTNLGDLNFKMLKYFLGELDIDTKIVLASDIDAEGQKSDLVLNICKHFGASEYISGALGSNYLDEQSFEDIDIKIAYQHYQHPVYNQLYNEFQPYMAIIDLLFNCGAESKNILLGKNK